MPRLVVELTLVEEELLEREAEALNLPLEDLVAAIVRDAIGLQSVEFGAASTLVLEKNRELYRRLSRDGG